MEIHQYFVGWIIHVMSTDEQIMINYDISHYWKICLKCIRYITIRYKTIGAILANVPEEIGRAKKGFGSFYSFKLQISNLSK